MEGVALPGGEDGWWGDIFSRRRKNWRKDIVRFYIFYTFEVNLREMIRKRGRPDLHWNDHRPHEAYKLALLGAKDTEMADIMGISEDTLNLWKRIHPEFKSAVVRGKRQANAEVAEALYKRATGFWVDVVEPMIWKGEVFQVAKRKYFPPDTMAAKGWLALRERQLWAEVQRIENTQTNINITKIDLTGFTKDELILMQKVGLQSLVENAGRSQN